MSKYNGSNLGEDAFKADIVMDKIINLQLKNCIHQSCNCGVYTHILGVREATLTKISLLSNQIFFKSKMASKMAAKTLQMAMTHVLFTPEL